MMEWLVFAISALLMVLGLAAFGFGIFGIYRFGFVLNRMHAAAICDTAGLLMVVLSLMIARGFDAVTVKLILIVAFFWMTGPISSHLIAKMEYFTDPDLNKEVQNSTQKKEDADNGSDDL